MRILVTGGAGFIGSHVAEHLLAAGHEVAIVDNLVTGHRENVPPGATFYEIDILDPALSRVFADVRPEVVCHHAAQMSVRVSIKEPRLDAAVNVEGTVNVLESAVACGARKVIYASTGGAIYGEPTYLPCDEEHPVAPLCQYGVSKFTVETYLALYARLYGLDFTVLRYPNVYGPRQDPEGEAGVVAIFAGQMLDDLPVTIYGDGSQERNFVSVRDVARANLLALDRASKAVVNLGSGVGASVQQVFTILAGATEYARNPVYARARFGEVYRICLSLDRARDLLGWEPEVDLRRGLTETASWISGQAQRGPRESVALRAVGDPA